MRLLRHLKDVQGMIEDFGFRIFEDPVIAIGVVEELTGKVVGADDDGASDALIGCQGSVADTVELGIDGTEISEVDGLAGMLLLVFAERDQTLAPIDIAVAQELIAGRGFHKGSEVRKVVRRVTQDVRSLKDDQCKKEKQDGATLTGELPQCADPKQCEGIDQKYVALAQVNLRENGDNEINDRKQGQEQQLSRYRNAP